MVDPAEESARCAATLVARPKFELIPLVERAREGRGAAARCLVTVTASPSHGLEATFDLAWSCGRGPRRDPAPERAHDARRGASPGAARPRATSRAAPRRSSSAATRRTAASFHDGLSLLRGSTNSVSRSPRSACPPIPRATPTSPTTCCFRAAREAAVANSMTTQMSFNPMRSHRGSGGCGRRRHPAGAPRGAGGGRAHEAHGDQRPDRRRRLRPLPQEEQHDRRAPDQGPFGPDALLESGPDARRPGRRRRALHVFTFNQVRATVDWQRRMLAELGEVALFRESAMNERRSALPGEACGLASRTSMPTRTPVASKSRRICPSTFEGIGTRTSKRRFLVPCWPPSRCRPRLCCDQ